MTPICQHNIDPAQCTRCATEARLNTLLWEWGCSVDSVPFGTLVDTDTACAVIAAARTV